MHKRYIKDISIMNKSNYKTKNTNNALCMSCDFQYYNDTSKIQKRCIIDIALWINSNFKTKNTNNTLCISCGLTFNITIIHERYKKDIIA